MTSFFAVVEDEGWLHVVEHQDGNRRLVIEDETDYVTASSNEAIDEGEVARIWALHKMGTSSFASSLPPALKRRTPPKREANLAHWTGVALSRLVNA